MAISTQNFTTIVGNAVAAVQGAAKQLVDLTVGSVLRSVVEAAAALALWLQGIALQIAALTRFATSNGTDADSWGADFGFTRLLAAKASGQVTFSRFTATNQASIPAATSSGTDANGNTIWTGGTIVQTADGTQQYQVIPDTTQSAYNATTNTYIIPAGTTPAIVTVQSLNAAAAANVLAGAISVLGQAIPYVDTVSNASAFTNGADPETDTAFKARFVLYIASLARATKAAVNYAITSQGTTVNNTLTENQNYAGQTDLGYFYAVVDNGTGSPPPSFLSTVSNAVDAVRPIGSSFGIFGPVIVTANVALTVIAAAGYTHATVAAAVSAALTSYINSLPIGATLNFTRIAAVTYGVAGVANVSGVSLNSGTADVIPTSQQIIKAGSVVVN